LQASCSPLLQEPIAAEDADQLAAVLKSIADPARRRLLSLIQAQGLNRRCRPSRGRRRG
jgi:ArsR family transcriptional regulator